MPFEKIDEKLFIITDKNFYDTVAGALVLPTKLLMIDSGLNIPKIREFRQMVEKETGKKFEALIITHYHGDHTVGNQIFLDCRIIAARPNLEGMKEMKERWTEAFIEKQQLRFKDPRALEGLTITLPNEIFEGQMEIRDGEVKVIVKQTGGHTDGSTYIYCPNYKILFAGDNLFINIYPSGKEASCDPDAWIEALKEYLALDVEKFVPGHGSVCNKAKVKETLDYFKEIKRIMKEMLAEGKPEKEILEKCYKVEFYPINEEDEEDAESKKLTLKRFYDVWSQR